MATKYFVLVDITEVLHFFLMVDHKSAFVFGDSIWQFKYEYFVHWIVLKGSICSHDLEINE